MATSDVDGEEAPVVAVRSLEGEAQLGRNRRSHLIAADATGQRHGEGDGNGGGQILFVEFSEWAIKKDLLKNVHDNDE